MLTHTPDATASHSQCRHQLEDQMLGVEDADAQTNLSPLMHAVNHGTADVATYLLVAGAEPNRLTNYEFTPLMLAAERGNLSILLVLLESRWSCNGPDNPRVFHHGGVNIHHQNTHGQTALFVACRADRNGSHMRMVRSLLEHGAWPNQKDNAGDSPMTWSARAGKSNLVRMLKRAADEQVARRQADADRFA